MLLGSSVATAPGEMIVVRIAAALPYMKAAEDFINVSSVAGHKIRSPAAWSVIGDQARRCGDLPRPAQEVKPYNITLAFYLAVPITLAMAALGRPDGKRIPPRLRLSSDR